MTRKSMARTQRDQNDKKMKELATGKGVHTGWDELNKVYQGCVKLILSHTITTAIMSNKELHACFDSPKQVADSMRLLAKDVKDHIEHLEIIHSRHKTRTGGERNADEGMRVIEINEAYASWMTAHDAIIMPTWMELMDSVARAEVRLRQKTGFATISPEAQAEAQALAQKVQAEADAINVDVITDVVINEPATQE